MRPRISSSPLSITACMTLALSGLLGIPGWTGEAQAATNGSILFGELEAVTLDPPGDKWAGGTMVVAGQIVTIPRNLLMDLPANRLTLQELFADAPAACLAAGQSGLAKSESCNAYRTGAIVSISANRTTPGGNLIAGDVFIQKGTETIGGAVTFINHTDGYFRLGGTAGDSTNGVMVRINDPESRHTVQQGLGCAAGTPNCSPDVRYTLDPDNYTNVFTTGYPICIPSTQPRSFVDVLDLDTDNDVADTLVAQALPDGTGDLLCPTTNRTVNNGLPVDDSRRFAPIMLGDHLVADGNWEIVDGVRFLSAHSTMVSRALTTKDLQDQPDYMFLNEVEIDVAGFQNQRARTLIIGFVSLVAPTADVMIWSLHYDPLTNTPHELPLASVVGCENAGGAVTCAAQGIGGVAGNNVFKIRHDVDFNVGAGPKLNPCAHLLGDPRMPRVCNNNAGGANIGEMLAILSPVPHEIQARTGKKFADLALPVPLLKTLDINGNEATNGQYLFPFGMNLGGISTPEFDEIDLNIMQTPLFFTGIPWNLDRRLSPGGCLVTGCELTPQPLTPFPFEGLDPRTQTNLPLGPYNDPVYTSATLTDVRNRILSFVDATGRAAGNATVLAWPPVNPAAFAIANTPPPPVLVGGVPNEAPVITSTASLTASVGSLYTNDVESTDGNLGDVVTYSLVAPSPAGMTIDSISGLISWTPMVAQAGLNAVNVRAMDLAGSFDIQSFIVTVTSPPVINSPAILTATVGSPYTYDVNATDVDPGNTITYSLTTFPAGMTIDSVSGVISWTPIAGQEGPQAVTVQATDNTLLSSTQSFSVNVAAAPAPPVINSTPGLAATAGVAYSYQVTATDVNGGPFTYSLDAFPAGMGISPTGQITWTPNAGQGGPNAVTVRVTDNTLLFATQPFSIEVTVPPPAPPVINSTPGLTATLNVAYSYQVTATDANVGDIITYSLTTAPAGMTINPTTGLISWTPIAGQELTNPHAVTVQATDNTLLSTTQSFTVTVAAPVGPTITGFILRNATTDTLIGPLTNGATISLAACGGCQFNVEATATGAGINNVRFVLTGATAQTRNEGIAPYTLPGDLGAGVYNGMTLNQGAHSLTATPRNAAGTPIGTALTVTFTVAP